MTQIIVITPLLDEKSFRAIADISAKGYEVLAISPSLIAIEVSNVPDTRIYRIARDIVRLERQVEIDLLRKHAVVVDWRVNEPLNEALQEATFLWTKVKRR
jgi:predicted CoA-binding protein